VKAVRRATRLPIDVHLMIESAERYTDAFVDAGELDQRSRGGPRTCTARSLTCAPAVRAGSRDHRRRRSRRSTRSPRLDFVLLMSVNPASVAALPAREPREDLAPAANDRGARPAVEIEVDGESTHRTRRNS